MGGQASCAGGGRLHQALQEYLSVGPDDIILPLRPLLARNIDELCELYHEIAASSKDKLSVSDLISKLGLELKAVRLLTRGKSSTSAIDVLAALAVASHTHALTKARFVFCMCDRVGEGRLDFSSFLAAMQSLLQAGAILGSGLRSPAPMQAAQLESLAWSLFKPHDPKLTKDAFVNIVSSQAFAWQMLRRFARGAVEQHFQLQPWEQLATKTAPQAKVGGPAVHLHVDRTSPDGQPLPRRKGYFLAVPTPREVELHKQIKQVHEVRANANAEELGSGGLLDLEIKEESLRSDLIQEVIEDSRRQQFRHQLSKLQAQGTRPRSAGAVLPRGRLWTASQAHCAQGGILPPGMNRPVTPREVKLAVESNKSEVADHMRCKTVQKGTESAMDEEIDKIPSMLPNFMMDTGLLVPPTSAISLTRYKEDGDDFTSEDDNKSRFSRQTSLARDLVSEGGFDTARSTTAGIRQGDVLLAFELYRSEYWRTEGAGVYSLRKERMEVYTKETNMVSATQEKRRNREMDLIMREVQAENVSAQSVLRGSRSKDLTLRGFLKLLWPNCTHSDMIQMLKWVKRSRVKAGKTKTRWQERAVKSDPALLKQFIELFDAIDTTRTGFVPVEAVEKFLCGEIITQRERARLEYQHHMKHNRREPSEFVKFVDHVRYPVAARLSRRSAEDRQEWQIVQELADPEHEEDGDTKASKRTVFPGMQRRDHQVALCRAVERNMESLACFLDKEFEGVKGEDGTEISNTLAAASQPQLPEQLAEAAWPPTEAEGHPERLRLARLYWRYLLGSAISQELRSQGPDKKAGMRLELRGGRLDLISFLYVLAKDQLLAIFPSDSAPPDAELLRQVVYAFDRAA
eukprot:TRINITY_DN21016_c0_g1_i1.p1 TRINITY_DN21016_c0_g1~~TRINITY_DN21016_c0_g1_i1.p1  ORF type:complete len:857 (+),score=133.52 TRINITY_DN21016_c0_g1_i1:71-2641(+)